MTRNETIQEKLLQWFRQEARDLPWRRTHDPYAVWLSEIILQQTRVDQGLPYYERFLKAFPTVDELAAASEEQVLKLWEGLGYYTRARNLHKAAQRVVEDHQGKLPEQAELLQLLPGVGRYTAGAIASIAFNEAVPVVDGNVKRVLSRIFDLDCCIDDTHGEKEVWRHAGTLVPAHAPGDFNQAMMELGARICVPKKPDCDLCPVGEICLARHHGRQEERPVRRPKKKAPHQEMVAIVLEDQGRYCIVKRDEGGMLAGLWEIPGGAVQTGESHQAALQRLGLEVLGVTLAPGGLMASVNHAYTHLRITLNVYRCTRIKGKPRPKQHTELSWATPNEFKDYPFHKAQHKFLKLL
jgi:A/G-specific adenine glycosylase